MSQLGDVSFISADGGNKGLISKDGQYTKYPYQIVCSQRRAIVIVVRLVCAIFALALIAALARPGCINPPNLVHENSLLTTSLPKTSMEFLSTDGRPFPWKEIRLPNNFSLQMYHIFMYPDRDGIEGIHGNRFHRFPLQRARHQLCLISYSRTSKKRN